MLLPDEFSVGPLADAVPVTLMIPRTKYESHFLIGGLGNKPIAICFAEDFKFKAFECAGNEAHSGMLVPNVRIEVDPASAVDGSPFEVPPGAIVRRGAHLGIMAILGSSGFGGFSPQFVPLVSNLSQAREDYGVGFRRWAITLGVGVNRRVLFEIDLTRSTDGATADR